MGIWIKNCGLKTASQIACTIETGATHIGLMHHERSPRHIDITTGKNLRPYITANIHAVAVMVDPDDATLDSVVKAWNPSMLQIHGVSSSARLKAISQRYALPLILAASVASEQDITNAEAIAHEAGIGTLLLDAAQQDIHGGTGTRFDWRLLEPRRPTFPWFLAGGLTPENVSQAITSTQPDGVDVSSGIESSRGEKSLEKIAAFNRAVLLTAHATQ